jgi:hypothetical protein
MREFFSELRAVLAKDVFGDEGLEIQACDPSNRPLFRVK